MTGQELLLLLSVIDDLVLAGVSSFQAIKTALKSVGATDEQFEAAKTTLAEISERRKRVADPS